MCRTPLQRCDWSLLPRCLPVSNGAHAAAGKSSSLLTQWYYVNGASSTKGLVDDPTATTTANPVTYITASDPAFLLFHGSKDPLVSPSQTLLLHNALLQAGVRSKRYVLTGASHGDVAFLGDVKSGQPWSTNEVMGIMVRFLKDNLG